MEDERINKYIEDLKKVVGEDAEFGVEREWGKPIVIRVTIPVTPKYVDVSHVVEIEPQKFIDEMRVSTEKLPRPTFHRTTCNGCMGTGRFFWGTCPDCKGTGEVSVEKY